MAVGGWRDTRFGSGCRRAGRKSGVIVEPAVGPQRTLGVERLADMALCGVLSLWKLLTPFI